MKRVRAYLAFRDGTIFEGEAAGALGAGDIATGEAVFNTAMSGYQEVITDPSYAGQVVAFTYPHIGNYGVTQRDEESHRAFLSGVIVRDIPVRHSNWRSEGDLESNLEAENVPAITGIDTRRLTRYLRSAGAMPCAFGATDAEAVIASAQLARSTDNQDLASVVSTTKPYRVGSGKLRVVALDLGIKATILKHLCEFATVEVVPASTTADEILSLDPDGIFLSNGPGDPAALGSVAEHVANLLGKRPMLGICLGHQVLAQSLGGRTYKLPFGHHGSNHPVKRLSNGHVEITAQNHNYAVEEGTVLGAVVTHINLNDGVIEGIAIPSMDAVSVQHHPEAGPGPHEASYLFDEFKVRIIAATGGSL
jgi:carbamoyl-phosphate synthase small subunit